MEVPDRGFTGPKRPGREEALFGTFVPSRRHRPPLTVCCCPVYLRRPQCPLSEDRSTDAAASGALGVQRRNGLPLLLRAAHDRARLLSGLDADAGLQARRRRLGPPQPLFRAPVPYRDGSGHSDGYCPRVPVRAQLVRLFGLRRQHLWRPAGHRSAARLFHGVDLHRPVDIRPRPPLPPAPLGDDLDGEPGDDLVGPVHSGRQLVDAAPGRLQGCPRPGGAHQLLAASW